jgi:hypothetical protein
LTIDVDVRNSQCQAVTITSVSHTFVVVASTYDTTLQPAYHISSGSTKVRSGGTAAPSAIPGSNVLTSVLTDTSGRTPFFQCSNLLNYRGTYGDSGKYVEMKAVVTLLTTAGNFTLETSNTHRSTNE